MKQGGIAGDARGFTIVETLIVLAVTGILLASAILYISGRQNKTQFMTSVNDLRQQLEQTISEASSGYPGEVSFKCHGSYTNGIVSVDNTPPSSNCVFVGKYIQFGDNSGAPKLVVWPLVGNQQSDIGGARHQVTSLTEMHPTAVGTADIDASSEYPLQNGLTIGSGSSVGGFGVVTSTSSYSSKGLDSGSQQFDAYTLKSSAITTGANKVLAAGLISQTTNLQSVGTSGVTLCVNSGTTNQSAVYTLGAGNGTGVAMQVRQGQCS